MGCLTQKQEKPHTLCVPHLHSAHVSFFAGPRPAQTSFLQDSQAEVLQPMPCSDVCTACQQDRVGMLLSGRFRLHQNLLSLSPPVR